MLEGIPLATKLSYEYDQIGCQLQLHTASVWPVCMASGLSDI